MNDVIENAKMILQSLNIDITLELSSQLNLIYAMELEKILNYLNRDELPKRLTFTLANRVVGRFLYNSITLGKFKELDNLTSDDLLQVVSIKEYETNIHYGTNEKVMDDRKQLLKVIDSLLKYNEEELHKYRRLIWI